MPLTTTARVDAVRVAARAVLAIQLGLFVGLGLPDGALGVAWPSMRGSFGQSLGDLGLVLAVGTLGYLAGSASAAALARRVGTPPGMGASAALSAVATAAWAATNVWAVLLVAALTLGLARGVIDAGMNAYVALHGGVRRLGLLHGAYGIGTSLGPLVVVASLAMGSWRPAWVVLAALNGVLAVCVWRWRREWEPDVTVGRPHADAGAGRRRSALIVPVVLACFAVLVGAEYSTGVWSYTLLTDGRGTSDTAAGLWVAGYWIGLTVARFVLGAIGDRFGRVPILHVSSATALAGVIVLWWDPAGAGALGLPVAGFGFGSIFPTLVALMPDRVGAHRSSTVIGWSVAAASLGGTAVAAAAGVLADQYGPWILAPALAVVTAAVGALHLALVGLAPVNSEDRRLAGRPA